jgi:peptide/nickel transport system substrate-binding protein
MHSQQWRRLLKTRFKMAAACCAVLALAVAACSSSGGGSGSPSASSSTGATGAKVTGGTATWALPPNSVPNYIFPFSSSTYFSTVNFAEFQYLMYRPLYWFGNGASPTLNSSLSLADPPVYNGRQVTITMKGWKWSNGETVNADDLEFWIHMMQAVAPQDWGDYVPGLFPSNISNVKVTGPLTLTMTMDKAYNPTWFTDNELSQLTPMPMAWDKTASGPSDCTAVTADCAKVYAYLDSQSKSLSTWVSSPVWSVVDGPWKLASFNADGNSTLIDFELTDEGAYRGCSSRRPGGMSARSTESCECLSGRRGP